MRRLWLLSVLIYGLLILGLAILSRELVALAIPLALYLGAAFLYGPEPLRLRASRTLSTDRVSQGTPVTVELSLTNEGGPLEEVLVEDLVPREVMLLDGEPRMLTTLRPGETISFAYTVMGKRGGTDFQGMQVTVSDHLGLFRRWATLPVMTHLFVFPQVSRLRRVAIRPLQTHSFAGPVPARQGGAGVEFFGVREYQLGDPLRWINWRVSARHPRELFTNEFEQERIADVGLILDARRRNDVHAGDDSLFEHAVRAAASLAQVFLSDGNRVGLLVYGWFLDWTFPGYGKVQRERILRALARARTSDSIVFDTLDYLPVRFFPARSQIVVISPLCQDDLPVLTRLRARGYSLLVISPDPISFEERTLGPQPGVQLAVRIARLERTLLLRKLRQAGIRTVDWQVDKPFDQAIHAALGRRSHLVHAMRRLP